MKGMILAAGLGTRLKPWTDRHPKALAPVDGKPMLLHVAEKMQAAGIKDITVNVFHFADQIIEFIKSEDLKIKVSDERPELLETGGALLKAQPLLEGESSILVHNADILSNADFNSLESQLEISRADVALLVSERDSSRRLLFDSGMNLVGWHNRQTDEYRPSVPAEGNAAFELAFSGIYIIQPSVIWQMNRKGWGGKFSIIEFLLASLKDLKIAGVWQKDLRLIDIGRLDSLHRAQNFLKTRN